MKGINLHYNFRFILITENLRLMVFIYIIRNIIRKKPVIIIDSQRYGDTRGTAYDNMLNKVFIFVFFSAIVRINATYFIVKSNKMDLIY